MITALMARIYFDISSDKAVSCMFLGNHMNPGHFDGLIEILELISTSTASLLPAGGFYDVIIKQLA